MNELINKLAVRAGALEVKTVLNTPPVLSLNGDEIAKFAELIIKECCAIVHVKADDSLTVVCAIKSEFDLD